MMKVSKDQVIDFVILLLRWYLAYYMVSYGWAKMTGGQFQIHDPKILTKPITQIDKFYIAWYLFSLSKSFDIIVGLTQLAGAALIVFNRTALIGALLLLPVLGQIFLIDVAFTTSMFGEALPLRLAGMIASDLLILVYYREPVLLALKTLTTNIRTRYCYQWWVYLLLPLLGLLTDFAIALLTSPLRRLFNQF
ncbi:hypothetical protein [Spirosoma pollinicola]|uniref:DoxX family protein n=1 Tax=Spirosoma pollinicola TaxID=2057025 RepID=A0A2K8ZB19_9BACT|nr:hypothetical protein [Spirosoma pollinicola]AUD07086.1 hypothetical protein CWM47_37875 [Spirosoma pollinicola]